MHVALVEPEIPQNTGSIARTCAATNTPLHLIGKLGFEINERNVRRAGLDYWPHVQLHQYLSWGDFEQTIGKKNFWYLSKHGEIDYWDAKFTEDDVLVFGSETKGLGLDFLRNCPSKSIIRIPMHNANVRSLNLSNAASLVLYEALRQTRSVS